MPSKSGRRKGLSRARKVQLAKARSIRAKIIEPAESPSQLAAPIDSFITGSSDCAVPNADIEYSRTRKKLKLIPKNTPKPKTEPEWTIAHIGQLSKLVGNVLCPNCFQSTMIITISPYHQGLASELQLQCKNCTYLEKILSSPRIDNVEIHERNRPFEINSRITLLTHELGMSYASLEKMANVLGLPLMHKKTFQSHDKRVSATEVEHGEEALKKAVAAVRQAYADTDSELAERMERDPSTIVDISCSFDGTWQKRGFTSMYGVGICIDVLTGLVVDFIVLSLYCHTCTMNKANKSEAEFDAWLTQHQTEGKCSINHDGSSKKMEQVAAEKMWARSIEKGLRYKKMLSDGDSNAFRAVSNLNLYPVEKLECVNHAHKRMGTALRKLAKQERLGGNGYGRLTIAKCNNLQNYYRGAILDNLENVEKMKVAIWATFFHCISTDNEPHHTNCNPSWCFYQKAVTNGEEPPSHQDHRSSTFLAKEVAESITPVYRRMSDEQLLRRLCHGGTQNQNESLNSQIWLRCPKTTFMGKRRVDAAVARAVSAFNEGNLQLTEVMAKLWLDPVISTLERLGKADEERAIRADAAATENARRRRLQRTKERRDKCHQLAQKEGTVYEAGMAD